MKIVLVLLVLLTTACSKGGGSGNNNQPNPILSINSISLTEGNGGTTNFAFTVTLSRAVNNAVSFTWSTIEGTAKAGTDYTAVTNQQVSFAANETSKTI